MVKQRPRSNSFMRSSRSSTSSIRHDDDSIHQKTRQQLQQQSKDTADSDEVCDDASVGSESAPVVTAAEENRALKAVERKEIEEMALKETMRLRAWRMILLLVMMGTGIMVSIGTFLYIRQQQEKESLQSYKVFARTVTTAVETHIRDFRLALTSLAQLVTVDGLDSVQEFPFVRISMFELPASHTRSFSHVESVSWHPLVKEYERLKWMEFVVSEQDWHDESKRLMQFTHSAGGGGGGSDSDSNHVVLEYDTNSPVRPYIWRGDRGMDDQVDVSPPGTVFAPIWQTSPPPYSLQYLNYDMFEDPLVRDMQIAITTSRAGLMSAVEPQYTWVPDTFVAANRADQERFHDHEVVKNEIGAVSHPHSLYLQPVFDGLDDANSNMVGFVTAAVAWGTVFNNLLPQGVKGIDAVLHNTCGQAYTYTLQGREAVFKGPGDLHDNSYDDTRSDIALVTFPDGDTATLPGHCVFSISLYNSDNFQSEEKDNLEFICAFVVVLIFSFMGGAFFMYDRFVHRRNTKIVGAAATSNAFISTLFPSEVKKRLLEDRDEEEVTTEVATIAPKANKTSNQLTTRFQFDTAFNDDANNEMDVSERAPLMAYKSKPIADLFTETTILFADIAGFSAWSSVREPSQVFIYLETLFRAFDDIAKKRKVFKVETVGDCYVAVAGLPEARKDHAVVMARYAHECMLRMRVLSSKLEVTFGPDTGDLAMRMGLHSGPVTAGVLRGDRSRFQLFGDTMNTASRMESNGQRDKIHISQDTADLLTAAGKMAWLSRREDAIYTKGKGEVQTYWLEGSLIGSEASSQKGSSSDESIRVVDDVILQANTKKSDAKSARLIKWGEDVLLRLLKQIVARRKSCPAAVADRVKPNEARFYNAAGKQLVDEIKESIAFPRYKSVKNMEDADAITLDPVVVAQLRSFVTAISAMYESNEFHNFEHASHVAMSVVKLLSRIVDPTSLHNGGKARDTGDTAQMLHERTFGIASDPLSQFSCVFAALIHDVGHPGVPNDQLVKEQNEMATKYQNQCMAEQNSIQVAWDLLFQKEYTMLRNTIYETDSELMRFRHIVVNTVLATDFFNGERKAARNHRWERAFSEAALKLTSNELSNRKATIALEHLLQASDISHTMQHWHIYRKWNERFFLECYEAYLDGRADRDPADEWYESEIRFFDFNVIPLAHKLKECGVFGISSEEYLNYAVRNRQEWEKRGRDVVNEMVARIASKTKFPLAPPVQAS